MIYLLHFSRPLKHAKHYMGYAEDIEARLARHRSGDGARLLRAVLAEGIEFELVRTWPGGRVFERKLKRRRDTPKLCPICNPQAMSRGNYKNE